MFLRFSLSCALNSVTRRPADPINTTQRLIDPRFDLVHVETGTDRVLMPKGNELAEIYVGRKWLVHCTGSGELTMNNLLTAEHAEVRLGNFLPEDAWSCAGIVQGVRGEADHVMFVFNGSGDTLILVQVDLCETYRTRELGVMHMTRWVLPAWSRFSSAVVMRRCSGERVVYVEVASGYSSGTVFELCEGGCAPPRSISTVTYRVSKLSSSTFCICKSNSSAELWDCNNTAAPLRVVPGRPSIAGVTAESGFLFHREFDRKIDVTDPHGGLIGTISFPDSILCFSVTGFT
ncbi:hypothetical protein Pelo_14447 [Pelomyxa schiedti]|nr:hypothetical protein Pelo_14447 [Pelomyxa schiedti]